MAQVGLAKIMKVKNRLAGRLSETNQEILLNNSVLLEQKGLVDIAALVALRSSLAAALVALKSLHYKANFEVQEKIFLLGEKKAEIGMYKSLSTRCGTERHDYQNTTVEYVVTITNDEKKAKVKQLEAEIDKLQDEIDEFNVNKKVEIPNDILALAS
jgi:hypothetical protein